MTLTAIREMAQPMHLCPQLVRLAMGIALAVALAVGLSADSYAVGAPIKVMSFNIRADFDFGTPTDSSEAWIALSGNHRRNLVTALVNQQAPDVLGVQEAFRNQVVELQIAMPGYAVDDSRPALRREWLSASARRDYP